MPHRKTFLVSGAAGFIAFHLISDLLEIGHCVIGIDNYDSLYDRGSKERNVADLKALARRRGAFEFHEMDICELQPGAFNAIQVDAVFHLAAKVGVRASLTAPAAYAATNVVGTVRVLEWMRRHRTQNLMFASSSSVYGDDTPAPVIETEAASKRSAELHCQSFANLYGLRIAILRYFTVYGPRQRPDLAIHLFSHKMLRGETIELFVGNGDPQRDYTFVSDTVSGTLLTSEWLARQAAGTCEIFNLGRGVSVGLEALVSILEKAFNIPARVRRLPCQAGDVLCTISNSDKAKKIGYDPKVSINAGVYRFVQWLRATSPEKWLHSCSTHSSARKKGSSECSGVAL